jgi:ribosomal protein L29
MYVIHLTDAELETARHALRAYLSAFGHDEAETVGEIKRVIAKLNTAQTDGEDPRLSA